MKKITLFSLLLLIAAGCSGTALASSFTGSTVSWQYYAYGGPYAGVESSGSFTVNGTVGGTFIDIADNSYFNIIAGSNYVTFDYSVDSYGSATWADSVLSLSPDIYNGIDLMFTGAPTITSVTIDPATNMVGFASSYLYFTGSEIQVDWHLLPFDTSTIVKLDLNGTSTPEPGSLLLFGSGLLGAVGVIRRKIRL